MHFITTVRDAATWLSPGNPQKFARPILVAAEGGTINAWAGNKPAPQNLDDSTRVDFVEVCRWLRTSGYNLPQKAYGLQYLLLAESGNEEGEFDMCLVWLLAGPDLDEECSKWGGDKRCRLLINS